MRGSLEPPARSDHTHRLGRSRGFLGLFDLRWWWLHAPAVLWSAIVNLDGWTCPLTPLEQYFRHRSATAGYKGVSPAEYDVHRPWHEELGRAPGTLAGRQGMSELVVLILFGTNIALAVAAWYLWRFHQNDTRRWRREAGRIALIMLSSTTITFGFHIVNGILEWPDLSRRTFEIYVTVALLLAVLAAVTSLAAKGWVRCTACAASLAAMFLWLIVAAWSWM